MNLEMEAVPEWLNRGSIKRWLAVEHTLKIAEPCAVRHVVPAFCGDVDAADALCAALGKANRGIVAVWMWLARVERAAYRVFLGAAWMHEHDQVMEAARTRRRLAAMFAYAAFPPLLKKPAAVIDGDENDWHVGHAAYQENKRRLVDALRKRIAATPTLQAENFG